MLRWSDFSRIQLAILLILWVCFNFLRAEDRIARPLEGDEQYQVKLMASYPVNLDSFVKYAKYLNDYDPGRTPFCDYLICWPFARWAPHNKYVACIPYVLIANLFFWIFGRVKWESMLRPALDVSQAVSFKWINDTSCDTSKAG